MNDMPGGPISARPLHFFWVLDVSGSMAGEKIAALNFAVREAIPAMRATADENPHAQVLVGAVAFSNVARWIGPQAEPLDTFSWTDLTTGGVTAMGAALTLIADHLGSADMPSRALPPAIVLVSDGQPTDDFDAGLRALMRVPWGRKAVRLAIRIGPDADAEVLRRFIGNDRIEPIESRNAGDLREHLRWASTVALKAASEPSVDGSSALIAQAGAVPTGSTTLDPDDVW